MMETTDMENEINSVCAELRSIPPRLAAMPPSLRNQVAAEIVSVLARMLISVNLLLRLPPNQGT
jgi:hypothetical protein